MTIRRRLAFSFLAILILFGLNLVIHFWSDQKRDAAVESLRRAILRQTLLASMKQTLNDLQKQVALLSQIVVEATTGGADPEEIARFNGQIENIGKQIQELHELSDADAGTTVKLLQEAYQELSASWRTFYENFGLNHTKAIMVLATRADPLSQRVLLQLLPRLEEGERLRVQAASANFH